MHEVSPEVSGRCRLHPLPQHALTVTRRVRTSFLMLLVLLSFAVGSPGQNTAKATAPAAPERFERVLWCSDPVAGPELARRLGYTGVQLGRGGDPAPLRELGLGFYLDQPIGKGLLELRDAEWQPVVQQFERTRDASALVRPGCFAVPGRVADAAAAAAAEAARVAPGGGLLFVALADEASATRHNAPLDTCRCEHCLRDFRRFAEQRFGTVDALNGAQGTHFVSFADVVPLSTDQVRRRELGERLLPADLRAFALWLDFVDEQFADAVRTIAQRVQARVPTVPVGLTGLATPAAFGGHDYARFVPHLTLAEPYDIGGAVELARSLLPASAHRYATLFAPDAEGQAAKVAMRDLVRAQLAAMACHGLAGVVVWNDAAIVDDRGQPSPFGAAVQDSFARLGPLLDTCAGAVVEPGLVWVVESPASVRVWWMLDSAADGMTWVRRLSSYEQTHSTSQAARRGWSDLLQDLGLQPQFVAEASMPERLLIERPRCVVLPATIALAERTAQALTAYVQSGGTVIADHSTGLYDGDLLRREAGGLDRLFGIERRSLAFGDLLVREGRSTARGTGLPAAELALRGGLGEQGSAADTFLERSVGSGRSYYLNVPVAAYPSWRLDEQRVEPARELRRRVRAALARAGVQPPCEVRGDGLPTCVERVPLRLRDGRRAVALRINALARPALLKRLGRDGPVAVEVGWLRKVGVRSLDGVDFGVTQRCEVQLDPFGAVLLEVDR